MNVKIIFANINGGLEFTGTKYGETNLGDDAVDDYARIINEQNADIVSLTEVHLDDQTRSEQVKKISQKLQMPYYDILGTDKSHLVEGKILGNAVLSKFPITSGEHFMIKSPGIEIDRPNGDHWVMHNKGAQTVLLEIRGRELSLTNLQYFAFHHFMRAGNEPAFAPEREMLVEHLTKAQDGTISIVTGDFNNKGFTLKQAFPELFDAGFAETFETDTTVAGDSQQLDHILYKPEQAKIVSAGLFTTPSDHLALQAIITIPD